MDAKAPKKLKYYEDTENGFLFAYERESEFFVRFLPDLGEWESVGISFRQFLHDYTPSEITPDEAARKSNGILPDSTFKDYLEMLESNLRG